MPLMLPPTSPTGILQFHWIDPTNTTRDLTQQTSPNLFVSAGATGLGAAPVDLAADKVPFASGSLIRHANVPPRVIELPVTIIEESLGDLATVVDALLAWFGTADERSLTPGTLRVTRPDGTVRQITAYVTDITVQPINPGAATAVVSMLCPDPWPTGDADIVLVYGPGNFNVERIAINPGELDAYPIWFVMGPVGPNYHIDNTVTGGSFGQTAALSTVIGATFDTRPASQRTTLAVRRYPDNLNLYGYMLPNPDMFPLAAGENRFRFVFTGTNANTRVELRYRPRYRGLLR